MENHLNTMGHWDKEEERILEVFRRGLLREFPNPDRYRCPPPEVIKRIASHEMPLSEAEKWLDHLGSCGSCYRDYLDLQAAHRKRFQWAMLAVAAGILLLIPVAGRILLPRHHEVPPSQITAVLDLRNRSVARGAEQGPAEGPLEVSRYASLWDIQLPLGSADGPYEVRLATPQGQQVFAARGVATISGGITLLRVELSLAQVSPDRYLLQIRRPNSEWNSYPIVVH